MKHLIYIFIVLACCGCGANDKKESTLTSDREELLPEPDSDLREAYEKSLNEKPESLPTFALAGTYDNVVAFTLNYDLDKQTTTSRHQYFGENLNEFDFTQPWKWGIVATDTLDVSQIETLVSTVTDSTTYGQQYADCFEPRLGFTFLKDRVPVFDILVCFGCGFLEASSTIPATQTAYYELEMGSSESQTQYRRYLKGFSEEGREKLVQLCNSLSLPYCGD